RSDAGWRGACHLGGMASRIENYGFIGNQLGSALVSRAGSVDWLCVPRFDSGACMAALLGRDEHGCFWLEPGSKGRSVERRYRPGTMILETDFACDGGLLRVVDFMPLGRHSLVRIVQGLEGEVTVDMLLAVRFGYGQYRPWVTTSEQGQDIQLTAA